MTGGGNTGIGSAFVENWSGLRAYLRRFLSRPQDIEDVLQETYIKAVEAEKRTVIHNPRAFLYRVSRNLALNEKGRAVNRLSAEIEELDRSIVVSHGQDADDAIDQKARFEMFCRAVRSLPPKCRRAFVLGKVYGLSHTEIAERLNISVSTVEKHLVKGLVLCKRFMDEEAAAARPAPDAKAWREPRGR